MGCFSADWLEGVIIDVIKIGAVVLILRVLLPWILSLVGWGAGPVMKIVDIIIGAIVLIFVVIIVFHLLGCAGGHLL